jgi:hypothetical protein
VVTPAERAVMIRVLDTCPSQRLPSDGLTALATGAPVTEVPGTATARHTTAAPRPTAVAPSPSHSTTYIHPGAYCAPPGSHGFTDTGTYEVCSTTANSPTRSRWHSAS